MNHLEYLHDYGHFTDLPLDRIYDSYELHYPEIFAPDNLSLDEAFTGIICAE